MTSDDPKHHSAPADALSLGGDFNSLVNAFSSASAAAALQDPVKRKNYAEPNGQARRSLHCRSVPYVERPASTLSRAISSERPEAGR